MDANKQIALSDTLNTSGAFLQIRIYESFKRHSSFKTLFEESFTYPPSNAQLLGKDGSIDILTVYCDNYSPRLVLIIECKKANPDIKNWIFFRQSEQDEVHFPMIRVNAALTQRLYVRGWFPDIGYLGSDRFDLYNLAFEINENWTKINKSQQDNIYKSLFQVNHGLIGIYKTKFSKRILPLVPASNLPFIFIPIVITTANLLVAKFKPEDISLQRGEIDKTKIDYNEKPWIVFNYGLPDFMKISANLWREGNELSLLLEPDKRITFIVNSDHLDEFYKGIINYYPK